jgi:hypothetical protein
MEAASPDLEKQGFFSRSFYYREYSGQQDRTTLKTKFDLLQKSIISSPIGPTHTILSVVL